MSDAFHTIIFHEELTPDEQDALRARLSTDPELARLFVWWGRLRAEVRHRLATHLPDRNLLVLYALDAQGDRDTLTDEERDALYVALPGIEAALVAYPALHDVVARIQAEQADFEAAWDAHFDPHAAPRSTTRHPATPATPQAAPSALQPLPRTDGRGYTDRPGRTDRPARPARRRGGRIVVPAAVMAFAVAVAAVLFVLLPATRQVTVSTAAGEMRTLTLGDGSTVRLRGASTLSYRRPRGDRAFSRHVRLAGEAFFEVEHGSRGFTVETRTALTRALGTDFSVRADAGLTEVTLANGQVSLATRRRDTAAVILDTPGQVGRVHENAPPVREEPVEDLTETFRWTGLLVFNATPLSSVAQHLHRTFGTAVEIAPELRSEPVVATFYPEQSLEEILNYLAATLGAADVEDADGGYRIVPAS